MRLYTAFAVSDFDAAEKDFGQAEKDGFYESPPKDDKLAPIGQLHLESVGYYREAWETEKAIRDRETKDDDLPRVLLKTSKGDIELELFENEAPNTVKNFIYLVQRGFYDGLTFHRVLPDFVAQAGDPSGTGFGGPGYAFINEVSPDLKFDREGLLAMANSGPDTNGSQFFITYAPAPQLDGGYTIFGEVISGMDIARKLAPRDPSTDFGLPPGDEIISVTIEEK